MLLYNNTCTSLSWDVWIKTSPWDYADVPLSNTKIFSDPLYQTTVNIGCLITMNDVHQAFGTYMKKGYIYFSLKWTRNEHKHLHVLTNFFKIFKFILHRLTVYNWPKCKMHLGVHCGFKLKQSNTDDKNAELLHKQV